MEEVKYIPKNNLYNRGYIDMYVTNGIEIKDKNYFIVEYKVIGDSLYAILTQDFRTYFKQLLTGISDQATFDDTDLRNRISRLEKLPQYRYDDSYLRDKVGGIEEHSTKYESTTNTRLELLESRLTTIGHSAYDVWLSLGNKGTEQDFINYLKGEKGDPGDGITGQSAYDVWLSLGNTGSKQDFINSLKGEKGEGTAGKSAYDVWLSLGNEGTKQDFINSLKGAKGDTGDVTNGHSAYDVWLSLGHTGTEQDFIDSLKGAKGDKGEVDIVESVYDVWLELGNTGTKQDFIKSLKGEKGDKGDVTDIGTHALVKSTVNITNSKTPLFAELDHYKTLTYNTKSQLGILHLDLVPTVELGRDVLIGKMTASQPKPYSLIEMSVMGNNTDGVGQIYVKTNGDIMCNYLKANTRYTVDLIGYFE